MDTVTFRTLTGETLTATLMESESDADPLGRVTLFQTIEVSQAQYEQIAANEWFNFHAVLRPARGGELLEAGLPVQLELGLRAPLLARLAAQLESPTVEAVLALVAESAPGEYNFIVESESWVLYTVKQLLPPLPSMDEDESIASGFTTRWQEEREAQSLVAATEGYFEEYGWTFERVKDTLFRATVVHEETQWLALVQIHPDHSYLIVYSVLPAFVPEAQRPAMLFALNDLNYHLAVGNFEMDGEDGELRFRTSADAEGTRDPAPLLHQLLTGNISTMKEYLPLLQEIARGQ